MTDIEGEKFIAKADEMVDKLFEVIADEEYEDLSTTMMLYVAAKFSAGILLAVQEETYNFDVEDEYLEVVKGLKKLMGKDKRIQKIKNEREEIERKLAENEIKLEEYRKKIAKYHNQIESIKHDNDMVLKVMNDDVVN